MVSFPLLYEQFPSFLAYSKLVTCSIRLQSDEWEALLKFINLINFIIFLNL